MAEHEVSSSKRFADRLQSDRLINVVVGKDNPTTYRIQKSLLEAASEYFVKAIKNQHMGNAAPDTLEFPEDGELRDAWEVLLYWILQKSLPDEFGWEKMLPPKGSLLLMQAWSLADRYLMPQLQDTLMLELLWRYDSCTLTKCNLTSALDVCPVDTPLRRLLAEEVVYLIYGDPDDDSLRIELSDLLPTDGATGWSASLLAALRKLQEAGGINYGKRVQENSNVWKEYMVAEGPQQHWVHQIRNGTTK